MIDKDKIQHLTYELLKALGENPEREGLKETPKRVANMYAEICSGLENSPENLIKFFDETSHTSDLIEVNNIPVNSICEHHLLPFVGTASIKYIPRNGVILGLSKFARVVDYFSKKPQVQERLTYEIAEFLFSKLNAQGVKVTLECTHTCMTIRGAKANGSTTKTVSIFGNIE